MARAITAAELAKLRSDGQFSKLGLAIFTPDIVMQARVNTSPQSYDGMTAISYYGITSGSYTGILPDQTVYVGSSASGSDYGIARIRKAADANYLYVGETSEVIATGGAYLTVYDEMLPWARHARIVTDNTSLASYMDYDTAYTDQHLNFDPVPIMGPDACLYLSGSSVTLQPSAAKSWVHDSLIASYAWGISGSGSIVGSTTTATPNVQFTQAGQYRLSCTVTSLAGKSHTGYRRVFVYSDASPLFTDFTLDSCEGDFDSGGWTFEVTCYSGTQSQIRDRAKVLLVARDWYGAAEGSLGPVSGYENIIATGWIYGESIRWNLEQGTVTFAVEGPSKWLDRCAAYTCGLTDSAAAPTDWLFVSSLTWDKYMWHIARWRSTMTRIMDVYATGTAKGVPNISARARTLNAPAGTIWRQLQVGMIAQLVQPVCDRYGRYFGELNAQYENDATRAGLPVVLDIGARDREPTVDIQRETTKNCANLTIYGASWDGANAGPLAARMGQAFARLGSPELRHELILTDQNTTNMLCGLIYGDINNEFPATNVSMPQNNRFIDIAPQQVASLTMAASENPRGLTWSAKKFIPRRVDYRHSPETGMLTTSLELEALLAPQRWGYTYIPPTPTNPNNQTPPTTPNIPPVISGSSVPQWPPNVPPQPPAVDQCLTGASPTGPYTYGTARTLDSDNPALRTIYINYPCVLRAGSVAYKSYFDLFGSLTSGLGVPIYPIVSGSSSGSGISIAAVDDSLTPVAWGSITYGYSAGSPGTFLRAKFAPATALTISGFRITIPDTANTPIGLPNILGTNTFAVGSNDERFLDTDGAEVICEAGRYYTIINAGGPWDRSSLSIANAYSYCLSNFIVSDEHFYQPNTYAGLDWTGTWRDDHFNGQVSLYRLDTITSALYIQMVNLQNTFRVRALTGVDNTGLSGVGDPAYSLILCDGYVGAAQRWVLGINALKIYNVCLRTVTYGT